MLHLTNNPTRITSELRPATGTVVVQYQPRALDFPIGYVSHAYQEVLVNLTRRGRAVPLQIKALYEIVEVGVGI